MVYKFKKIGLILALAVVLLTAVFHPPTLTKAQAGTAEDLIREVNELRAGLGAAPLEANSALAAAAQSHAEYMASLGYLTHTGLGGSRPQDRAVAAGYGASADGSAGSTVFISENIAVGRDLSPDQAVNTVWADEEHRNTMLNARYTHIGAGAAVVDGQVYYTIDVGYIAGDVNQQADVSPTAKSQQAAAAQAQATGTPTASIQTSTPEPDGSIIYEVKPGDSLWSIAMAHNIKIEDIQQFNGLGSSDVVWAGQKLFVAPTYTPTLVPTETLTPLPPTRTPRPTSTPRPPTLAPSPTTELPTLTSTPQPLLPGLAPGSSARRFLGIGMIVICGLGLVVILVGGLKKG